jgi:hypothetical protein
MVDKIEDELSSIKVNFAEVHGDIKTLKELTNHNSDALKELSKQVSRLNESVAALGAKAESDTLKELSKQVRRLNESVAALGVKANFNIFTSIGGIVAITVAAFSITNTMISRQSVPPDPVQMQAVFNHWQAQAAAQRPVVEDQWRQWFPPRPEPQLPAAGTTAKPTEGPPIWKPGSGLQIEGPGWEGEAPLPGRRGP